MRLHDAQPSASSVWFAQNCTGILRDGTILSFWPNAASASQGLVIDPSVSPVWGDRRSSSHGDPCPDPTRSHARHDFPGRAAVLKVLRVCGRPLKAFERSKGGDGAYLTYILGFYLRFQAQAGPVPIFNTCFMFPNFLLVLYGPFSPEGAPGVLPVRQLCSSLGFGLRIMFVYNLVLIV